MAIATVLGLALLAAGPPIDAEALIKKHEDAVNRIHAICATIVLKMSDDGGKTWPVIYTTRVQRSGAKEKIVRKSEHHFVDNNSKLVASKSILQILKTPEGTRLAVGIDPDDPPEEPVDVGMRSLTGRSLLGHLQAPEPYGEGGYNGYKGGFWPWHLMLLPDAQYSLRELWLASSKPAPTLERGADGAENSVFRIARPDKMFSYDISFNPKWPGILARRKMLDNEGKESSFYGTESVVETQEPKPGIILPKIIRGRQGEPFNRPTEVTISDVLINEPIPDTEFQLRFPRGMIVRDGVKNCLELWGDGGPSKVFKPGEYEIWMREQIEDARGRLR